MRVLFLELRDDLGMDWDLFKKMQYKIKLG